MFGSLRRDGHNCENSRLYWRKTAYLLVDRGESIAELVRFLRYFIPVPSREIDRGRRLEGYCAGLNAKTVCFLRALRYTR